MMSVSELKSNPAYKYHHTSLRRGYESRKSEGHVEPYSGRFGKGYIAVTPRWDSTCYVNVSYYIAKEGV